MAEEKKEAAKETSQKKKNIVSQYWWIGLVVVALAALAGGAYYYMQYQKTQMVLNNPTLAAQVQTQELINRVGQLIELPKDEQPTIATVSDVNKLKNQPFFANAQNGDKVLIYTNAKKAILYDPIANKVVDVAPVNIGAVVVSPVPTGSVTPTPTKKLTPTPAKKTAK